MSHPIPDPTLQCLFVEELTEQYGIEMVAVPNIERKIFGGLGCQVSTRQARCDEESVRMRMHVGAIDPGVGVVHELRHGQIVEHGGERVKIALEAGLGRPLVESDAAF